MATASKLRVGPADHGRRLTLADFLDAEEVPGYRYELAKGVIEVSEVPNDPHAQIVDNQSGLVLGNIDGPIPVTLDGRTHTVSLALGSCRTWHTPHRPGAARSRSSWPARPRSSETLRPTA